MKVKEGDILWTRHGANVGNAICLEVKDREHIVFETDFGNIMTLTYEELEYWYHVPISNQNIENWRLDREELQAESNLRTMSASEALYGLCAWITSRKESVTVGVGHPVPPMVDLIAEFCKAHDLTEPAEGWEMQLWPKKKIQSKST